LIKQICQELADDMGLSFVYKDFRKFFYEGKNDLRSRGFYIQKYCACNKSFEARFGKRLDEN
jgi:predicted adenine nucleotide alpha hydrolase (AANH) superfamily ATPase